MPPVYLPPSPPRTRIAEARLRSSKKDLRSPQGALGRRANVSSMEVGPGEQDLNLQERVVDNPAGRAALERLRDLARAEATAAAWSTTDGQPEFTKGSPIALRARGRHARRARMGRGLPRLNEFDNLTWLREAGFLAAQPLAALTTWTGGQPVWQGLVTVKLADARDASPVLAAASPAEQLKLAQVLGETLGRLHRAGFIHRDFYLRNLLFGGASKGAQLGMIDCWRGGPGRASTLWARLLGRGSAYDIGCLFVHLPGLVSVEAEGLVLESYRNARGLSRASAGRLFLRAARARRASAAREIQRKRVDATPIQARWNPVLPAEG